MASVSQIQEQIGQIATNSSEQATEVGRIRSVIEEIRNQLANGATPEQLEAISAQLGGLVTDTQAVEDNLRSTT